MFPTPMRRYAVALWALVAPCALPAQGTMLSAGPLRVAPTGGLAHYVAAGWGGAGSLSWRRPDHLLGLRLEASYVAFPFAPADHSDHPPPSQVAVLVSSGSTRLSVLAGPELVTRVGPIRASVHAIAGPAGAFTVMSLSGLGTDDRYSRRKRFADLAGAAQAGLGIAISLARNVAIDVSAVYGLLSPTAYGLRNQIKVGVISGPYWEPEHRWSQYSSYRLLIAIGT